MRLEYEMIPAVIRINIPCFLMISAYLFYRDFTWAKLPGKWKRRVKTLLVPYITWNLLYYAGYLAAGHIPHLAEMVNRPGLTLTASNLFQAAFRFAFNPVFWFMYQLLLLVALAPVLYLFLKNKWIGLAFLGMLFFALSHGAALPELNLDALIYYSAAAWLALHAKKTAESCWSGKRAFLGVILLAVGIAVSREYYRRYCVPAIVFYQVLAPASLWLMADERKLAAPKPWMMCTFFIYAFHFIPVRLINKAAAMALPGNAMAAGLLFFLMPVLAVTICYQAVRVLRRFTPKLWRLLNGGR